MTMSDVFGIEALENLREYLASISQKHVATMGHYASGDGKGFWHQASKRQTASLACTATCVSSLVRAGLWNIDKRAWGTSEAVAEYLLKKRKKENAGLRPNNPFGLPSLRQFWISKVLVLTPVLMVTGRRYSEKSPLVCCGLLKA